MKPLALTRKVLALLSLIALATLATSCETMSSDRERLSSMPHNIPQAWEGQAGLPGMMGAQGGY